MCGGFTCSKNALIALNIVYVVVAFLLIGVATYGKTASIITSLGVVGGIVACGVLLLFIAVLGLVGAVKHHQVVLFFYMLVLFLLYVLQFSLACACLAITPSQQEKLLHEGWRISTDDIKKNAQETFGCCGFQEMNNTGLDDGMDHPECPLKPCCPGQTDATQCCMGSIKCECRPCFEMLKEAINSGLRVSGGIGLFFSFTEMIGFVLAYRYRNQMDPSRGQMLD
ncbi:tetraspanin-13-like isoform X2 [Amphibalanus amphitrite]|uniref:tetraspanin-13-like isoform X2 n=1 Tax=Amphibalanus amphitrite TaxID=1232801 RepID=UPI001C9294C4|nr:tetraspanin-13-like isoform X2 [Amphibalanus amphitrite]XP_043227802.1 tetraspanin-13-like isoform X2 [Amphibalanus amphitrite]